MRRFFAAASEGILQDWPDPSGHGPPVSDQMTDELRRKASDILRKAELQAAVAVRLEQQGKQGDALRAWGDLIGKYFPAPEMSSVDHLGVGRYLEMGLALRGNIGNHGEPEILGRQQSCIFTSRLNWAGLSA